MKAQRFLPFLNREEEKANRPIYQNWRAGLMIPVLNVSLVLGAVALVAEFLTNGPVGVTLAYIGIYLTLLLIRLTPTPGWLRAGIIVALVYAAAVIELMTLGIQGDGVLYFLAFVILATMLYSPRGGIIAASIVMLTFGIIAWLTLSGTVGFLSPIVTPSKLADWAGLTVILLLFSSVIIVGFQQLDIEYFKAQKKTEESTLELEHQKTVLEERVAERTRQFKAVNEVGSAASSVLDPDELINRVVNLIADQFGYYYAAFFLIDPTNRWAELKSATGEAGRLLKENKHRLEIGGRSMVGTAISKQAPRVALNVEMEQNRFKNPLLPYTRSEIALPLLVGGRVLGALDVQAVQAGAFGPQEIDTLQNMANQVSIALDNARLFQQVQQDLNEIQNIQREYTAQIWERMANKEELHYEVGDEISSETNNELEVPLALRGGIIGSIKMDSENEWTPEQRNLIESIASQASLALENARLVEDSQSSAARERLIAEISGKIWSSTSMDGILRTAAQELGKALNASEATIELNMKDNL
jgi:GAF domain-containing protein